SQFYSCKPCLEANEKWIKTIISRKNTFNHKYYFDDPAIMTWELANEPRPMMPEAVEAYIEWVKKSAILIKSLAKNQLVTIGVEGYYGTE
ncbi:MAG TPA: beta-mannosidase, partial [Saprospirales bacterium]|nr:beta-mannosidase [Saprospirales bacterium]